MPIATHGLAMFVVLLVTAVPPVAGAANAIQEHMQHILTDGDQWRTANLQYDPERGGPKEFGLRLELQPDGAHVVGVLTGVFDDATSEVVYWSLLAFYNPVTAKVVTQQIGWDGTLIYGEVPLQTGTRQIVDAISYGADGSLKISRHENIFDTPGKHTSYVYDRKADGWTRQQEWTWARHPDSGDVTLAAVTASPSPSPLERHAGFLLAGSGRWRAPNPAFEAGSETEQFYGMNYRWGPNRQHIVGEIVSIYPDGRQQKDWSLYLTYNPVNGKAYTQQTGASGVYFHGELGEVKNNRRMQAGLIYLPNGTVKSVRDEIEIVDDATYVSHVFERDEKGHWREVRQWTWVREANAAGGSP